MKSHPGFSALLLSLVGPWGCTNKPAPDPRELALAREAEIAAGREAAESVEAELGLHAGEELQAYVERVGLSLARVSERAELAWQFRIADSPLVNAFALPGGFVYVTRGLLAHLGSEAALACVLAHQIGHVTARHGMEPMSPKEQAAPREREAVVFPEVRPFGDPLGGGLESRFPRFSREAEREADALGVRYARAAGYDTREMARAFSVLARVEGEARGVSSWPSTHQEPELRAEAILRLAEPPPPTAGLLGVDEYLRRLDGLPFGDDPREGFLAGGLFFHPERKLQVELPEDWRVRRTRDVVYAAAADGGAALELAGSHVPDGTGPESHARKFFAEHGLEHGTGELMRVGPFSAYRAPFRVSTPSGDIVGEAGFVSDGSVVYELLGFTRSTGFRSYSRVFRDVLGSFDRLRDPRGLESRPLVIRLYEVPEAMTFRDALERSGSDPDHHEALARLNGLHDDDELAQGALVKILSRGPP